MAYPQGNASQNMDLGIYSSDFSPDITVAGIVDNHTTVNKLGLRNSLGNQISLLQNFVCEQYLGRLSSPVGSGYINYLRGGQYSNIHYGIDPTGTGSYTYAEPGILMTKYVYDTSTSGVTISESDINSYRTIGTRTYQSKANGSWIQLNDYATDGTWSQWGSGLLKMVAGYGNDSSNFSSFIMKSTGDIILDTGPDPYTSEVIISGNLSLPTVNATMTIHNDFGNNQLFMDGATFALNNYSTGNNTQLFPSSIQMTQNASIYGFNNFALNGNGPIILNSERGSFNESYLTMSGENIYIQADRMFLEGEVYISGTLYSDGDNNIMLRQNPLISLSQQAYTSVAAGNILVGSGTTSYMTLKFEETEPDTIEIYGRNHLRLGALQNLLLGYNTNIIIEGGLPSSDPSVSGALYESSGVVMISL